MKTIQLSVAVLIGLCLIIATLFLGRHALGAYLFGETTTGKLINFTTEVLYSADKQDARRMNHNLADVVYELEGKVYRITVNVHLFKELKLLESGDEVLLAYYADEPDRGYVLSYMLFHPASPFLLVFGSILLILSGPHLIFHYFSTRRRDESK